MKKWTFNEYSIAVPSKAVNTPTLDKTILENNYKYEGRYQTNQNTDETQ